MSSFLHMDFRGDPGQLRRDQWRASRVRRGLGNLATKGLVKGAHLFREDENPGGRGGWLQNNRTSCRREHSSSAWKNQKTPEWKVPEAGFVHSLHLPNQMGSSEAATNWQSCLERCWGTPGPETDDRLAAYLCLPAALRLEGTHFLSWILQSSGSQCEVPDQQHPQHPDPVRDATVLGPTY